MGGGLLGKVGGGSIGAVSVVNLLLDSGDGLLVEVAILEDCFPQVSTVNFGQGGVGWDSDIRKASSSRVRPEVSG